VPLFAANKTILMLTGVTAEADLRKFAYQPHYILPDVGAIVT
jgi:ribonucleotide monophosphatase NagD (HAD superfamily)